MIHSTAHAHMPYVRRPCQDAHAPFEFEDSSAGFAQSSFIHITGAFGRAQGKPEPWDRLPWCWGMAMPCARLLQKGLGGSVYVRVTGTPVKPPSSGRQPVFATSHTYPSGLHPSQLFSKCTLYTHQAPASPGSILPTSSPNAPYTPIHQAPASPGSAFSARRYLSPLTQIPGSASVIIKDHLSVMELSLMDSRQEEK